ncbi:MAG: hypothetical protein LBT00_08005, partial [Spirochaetaceae bacterium]|nr:hypothetical protein [Spirochaetaceae bacterium]
MMTVQEAAEAARGLTFEKVWLTMQELSKEADRRHAELANLIEAQRAENDRLIKEQRMENDRIIKRMDNDIKKLEASVDRVSKNVGGLNRSMGALIETLIAARLWKKFPKYGLKRAYQRVPIYDEKNILKTDIDIL